MKTPIILDNIRISNKIEKNTSLAFLYNNTQVTINFTEAIKTSCSGNFCYQQRI